MRRVHVPAIDVMLVIDPPAPTVIQGFRRRVRLNRLTFVAIPGPDYRPVAEEGIGIGYEGFLQGFANQLCAESRSINVEIGFDAFA